MARALTTRAVETLRPTGLGRQEIPDAHMPGLYLVLQASGSKSWAVRYRHLGRPRKHTIGPFPAIDLKAARSLAGKALRAVAEGRDPGAEKVQARVAKSDSIESVAAEFIERHCKRSNRLRTAQETERLLRLHVLPRWRGRTITSITRRDVRELLDRMVDSGKPVGANRTLTAMRTMFRWAIERNIVEHSPCDGVREPTAEHSRDRTLTDPELRDVWLAADRVGWPFGPLVKLLILCGQRRDEVARMTWAELDLVERLWKLPRSRTKNNRPHEIPLSTAAMAVLDRCRGSMAISS